MTVASDEYYRLFRESRGLQVKSHGEVYTPVELVNEMLDALPAHVWTDPALRWFEPACGLAPFLYAAYLRLMVGLEGRYPDADERRRHILEEMFIFNEIQDKNVELLRLLFGSRYSLRLFHGCFLSSVPANLRADVVMVNPPYNLGTGERNPAWAKFVRHILAHGCVKDDGYLLAVHPGSWRKPPLERGPNVGLFSLLAHQNQLLCLDLNSVEAGQKAFGKGTSYDWYLLHRRPAYTTTRVRCLDRLDHQLELRTWSFLPSGLFPEFERIRAGGDQERQVVYKSCDYDPRRPCMSKQLTEEYSQPVINSFGNNGISYFYTSRKEEQHPFYGQSKVHLCCSTKSFTPIVDLEGKLATTDNCFALAVSNQEEADSLVRFVRSSLFVRLKRVQAQWSGSGFRLDYSLFTYLRPRFWTLLEVGSPAVEASPAPAPVAAAAPSVVPLSPSRCQTTTAKGTQCSHKATIGGRCSQHSKLP